MRTATNDLRALSACALVICLSACEPATPPTSPATAPTTRTTATPAPSAPEQVKNTASSLQTLLSVFAGQTAEDWSAFDNLSGVRWSDPKPLDNPDSVSPDATHYRGGDMLLAGFGEVDVPDGKVGAEAGIRKDNEGHVGVVLHGNANTVQSIALQKFYPSDDTKSILQRQFGGDATVTPIAGDCALDDGTSAANTQKNAFYELSIANVALPVFAETYVDEDGGNQGPGSTNFVFYRAKPQQRIARMHCKAS
ncbi:hypothetical protein [Variovorax sp. V15]|jgi:hypothetical protein|uniref:hypothetical protein n=1 Tax=unclassified Variovorax TaxID=663243 RepID=UPI0034E8E8C3